MKAFLLLLIIVAILCALFANQIDTAVNGKQQVRKVILVFSIGTILVCLIAMAAMYLA
ncbi:MAG: protein CrcB-like protein [Peptococcaceae bacterium]